MTKQLLLIDANALIHRFYHALPPLTSPVGEPTNALYGLCAALLNVIKGPTYIAGVFDRPEPTFRDEIFKEYKIHRPPAASELISQIKRARDVFEIFGIKTFELPGFEADDIIGTLAEKFKNNSALDQIIILSGDRDLLQLVEDDKVVANIIKTGVSNMVLYNEEEVEKAYGLKPNQLPDYKAFVGDASDNIPGVKGIGPKTILPFLEEFKNVEGVYENIGLVPPKVAKKIEKEKDNALLYRQLATIRRDAPIEADLKDLKMGALPKERLKAFFEEMGFVSLINRL